MSFAASRPASGSTGRRRRGPLLPTILVIVGVVVLFLILSRFWTEYLWYDQLGYTQVIRTEWITRAVLFVAGALVMGAALWVNLRVAYRNRPMYVPTTPQQQDLDRYREAFEPLRRAVFVGAPIVAAFFAGSTATAQWQNALLALNGQEWGQNDPQFGVDLSFFMFTLPFLRFIVSFLLVAAILSAVVSVFTHYLYGALQPMGQGEKISRAARIHTAILAAVITLLIGANYWLDRYSLLSDVGDRFDGASYTDINAVLPAKAILAVIAVFVALLFVWTGARGNWRLPAVGVALMVVSGLLVGWAYPAVIQSVRVNPNAQALESEYIQRNIDATYDAYGLNRVEVEPYEAETVAEAGALREDAASTASIRLLDPNIVSPTFRQLQQNKQYYTFPETLAVDRYDIDGESTDTVIAVRELDLEGSGQRSWVNDHTVFTHGFGVVAARGNTVTSDGRPQFIQRGIPSVGEFGDYEPRIYFSPSSPEYSIVGAPEGTEPWELDYPDDSAPNGVVNNTYSGDGGPSVGNWWNRLLYAARFGSEQIIFSDRVTEESQILYNRDPIERVNRVAPFLTTDGTTYPAVVDTDEDGTNEVVWVVDAYTTSNEYPYSARQELESAITDSLSTGEQQQITELPEYINYIRNSVKAVVNAYDGSVTLYAWGQGSGEGEEFIPDDPVLQTWMEVYPDTIQPLSEISGDLMGHLRYPEDLFKVQRELLSQYHVTDASTFYTGSDFWRVPNDPTESNEVPQPPYYLSLAMPGDEQNANFSLTSSFILDDDQRNVLTGFMAVNAEPGSEAGQVSEDYGTITLLELPRDLTVPGPGQVQNNFDSDTDAANELNILSRGGSQVIQGNLLTLPVGQGMLYVQPVYVQSSGSTQFPLLRRVLVAFGDEIGFAQTLDEALDQVFQGDSGANAGDAGVEPGEDEASGDGSDEGTGDGSGQDGGDGSGSDSDAQQRLNQALADAAQAMEESSTALADGDWAAYGDAQDRLNAALAEAIEAEEELTGQSITGDGSGDEGATEEPTDGEG
ncbi:MAG TPA: UPF0182 family protein [Candidatus Ruania gallistercoris]|uniref:UPF0182 protein H9815_04950 n=1 Tax=Candidatus Ruania gallistercoris TaxID=2838746 RepID=A0A9D2ED48_9MICO|nr:UPF0182 family protein [Candidatus Ruania gallistercoris]